ncbi:MAG: putative toxin-antitoxin system toxin component, PIN family [Chloroflexi bacterium]|nr:putative toxin-antitoxin system toxin component, PIN family [Chloroflexota bacterium]
MRKVVLDTNIFISGVITSGYSASILDAARREEIKLVTSAHLPEEFSDVISRRHITKKYPKAAQEAEALNEVNGRLSHSLPAWGTTSFNRFVRQRTVNYDCAR